MSKTVKKYDVCVIGAGIGGLAVTAACSMLGLKTALIERNHIGTACLSYGTIPSKAMTIAARKVFEAKRAQSFGINYKDIDVDFDAVRQYVHDVVKQMEPMNARHRYEGLGADIYTGNSSFEDEHSVSIEVEPFIIRAKHIVIATGSSPEIIDIEGLKEGMFYTNETLFSLEEKPSHLAIIGAGPIGVEMAQSYKRLGCDVTLVARGDLLSKEDPELVEVVRKQLIQEGVVLYENIAIEKVEKQSLTVIQAEKEIKIDFSHLLVATGRKANIANLGLSKAGVQYGSNGVVADSRLRTTQKHIYALGDCVNAPQFSYVASYHAGVVIKNMLFKLPAKVDYKSLPRVTYCDPALAWAGVTEEEARQRYKEKHLTILRWPYMDNDRARTEGRLEGMTKIIAYKKRIIGGGVVGVSAQESVQLLTLAIDKKMKISDLASYIAPSCTYGEVLKQAAGDYFKSKLFTDFMKKVVRFLNQFG